MPVTGVSSVGHRPPVLPVGQQAPADGGSSESFQKLLGSAVDTLNKLQLEADVSAAKLAAGEAVELHEVLIATEKASIAVQLAVQVKNKVVEAYQEVMRMQV
jgi:flagellar hook-basal body complex protein FliE